MHIHRLTIQLQHTDAYSILFFPNQLAFCQVVFQEWLASVGMPLPVDRAHARFLAVVVHAESDYKGKVQVGDTLRIDYWVPTIGQTSFVNAMRMVNQHDQEVGSTRITYVVVSPATSAKMAIPDELRAALSANHA